jgi:hypothetical protein
MGMFLAAIFLFVRILPMISILKCALAAGSGG